jgi:uronate dehydrogenase
MTSLWSKYVVLLRLAKYAISVVDVRRVPARRNTKSCSPRKSVPGCFSVTRDEAELAVIRSRRVLVTGARGLIGQVLRKALAEDYEVAGVDRRGRGGEGGLSRADTTRLRQAERAVEGADVVIDLASAHWQQPWDVVRNNNIPAAWNTLEAAHRRGVRRVIYASSNHVTGLYERDDPYDRIVAGEYDGLDPATVPRINTAMAVRPDSPYGVGKALGEAAARYYAEEHGLSVLCLRIGTVNRADRPSAARHFATLLTHADMVSLVRCCIEAPSDLTFGVFYGVSANRWRIWDIDDARHAIGYEPRDDAETWRGEVGSPAGPGGLASAASTVSRLRAVLRGRGRRAGRRKVQA